MADMKLKKTNYTMKVKDACCYGTPIYRRVWIDENGEYFVKFEGELKNVTFAKNGFMPD